MRHRIEKRAPFGQCDPAGIVYYPRFLEWFHDSFEQMFDQVVSRTYSAVLSELGVGFPAVQLACEFRAPVAFGDLVVIEIFLSRLTERSATVEHRVRAAEGHRKGSLLATASIKIAAMELATRRAGRFPEIVSQALRPFVEADDGERPDSSRIR